MELDHGECPFHKNNKNGCKHVFYITNAKVNKRGQVIFYVSSKAIDRSNTNTLSETVKLLKKIPTGSFHNARFDIDDIAIQISISKCISAACISIKPQQLPFTQQYETCVTKCAKIAKKIGTLTGKIITLTL
jgi:hypothetical protein